MTLATMLAWMPPSQGAAAADTFHASEVVSLAEMDGLRGGFRYAGMEFEFGANVRTFVDNELVLETIVSFSEALPSITEVRPTSTGSGPTSSGTPVQIQLGGAPSTAGIQLQHPGGGAITAIHQATRERILGILTNTANNVAARQELDVNITIRNFSDFQSAIRQLSVTRQLERAGLR